MIDGSTGVPPGKARSGLNRGDAVRSGTRWMTGSHVAIQGLRAAREWQAKRFVKDAAQRVQRFMGSRAYWLGSGYVPERDPHSPTGWSTMYAATPSRVIAEVEPFGFALLEIIGSRYPRRSRSPWTDWWYYASRRTL